MKIENVLCIPRNNIKSIAYTKEKKNVIEYIE